MENITTKKTTEKLDEKDLSQNETVESLAVQGSKLIPRYMELFERWSNKNDLTDEETTEMTKLSDELDSLKERMELMESKQ